MQGSMTGSSKRRWEEMQESMQAQGSPDGLVKPSCKVSATLRQCQTDSQGSRQAPTLRLGFCTALHKTWRGSLTGRTATVSKAVTEHPWYKKRSIWHTLCGHACLHGRRARVASLAHIVATTKHTLAYPWVLGSNQRLPQGWPSTRTA